MSKTVVLSALTWVIFAGVALAQITQSAPDQSSEPNFEQARRLLRSNAPFQRVYSAPAAISTAALVIVVYALARSFPNTHLGRLYADHNDGEIRNQTHRFEVCLSQHWGLGAAERSKTYENVVVECANEIEQGG